jgi:MoxR-like ATPase
VEIGVYVSDRRWQKIAQLLKASAFFNERKETNHSDNLLISYCIWTKEENRQTVTDIVQQAIKDVGFTSEISLHELNREKESLDKEIQTELFYKSDVYKTEKIGNKKYFVAAVKFPRKKAWNEPTPERTLYIPYSKLNTKDTFHPVDKNGNEREQFECTFDGHGTCKVIGKDFNSKHGEYDSEVTYTPKVLFHKCEKKKEVNTRLISSLAKSVGDIRKSLIDVLSTCEQKNELYKKKLASPFVSKELLDIPLTAIQEQQGSLQLRIKDCERLEALCNE